MKVSICSSVKNQSAFLKESVASIVAQTFKDWELVIVDDGSTEDIKTLLDEFKDDRIKLHRFEENKGIPFGINWAFQNSTGEYVQPIAADEVLDPLKLEQQVKYLDEHKEVEAVCGLPQHGLPETPMGERPSWEMYFLKAHNRSREQWIKTFVDIDFVPVGSCSSLWRRSVFDKIGYFNEALTAFVDHEWWVRFLENFTLKMLPFRWAVSRPNPGSVGATIDKEKALKEITWVREQHPKRPIVASRVTVAIPCKDMQQFIGRTIQSVLAQTHQDFEILVVDDGSKEPLKIEQIDPRIHKHLFVENKGQCEALNYMLSIATGDFFIPLSADDTLEPSFMEKCVKIFELNPCLEFIASQTDFVKEDGLPYVEDHPFKHIPMATNRTQDEWKNTFRQGNIYHGANMIRTQALKEIGGFNKESGVLSDYDVYLRLVQRFDRYILEENLTHTMIHADNQSSKCDQSWLRQKYFDLQKEFYPPKRKLIIATPFYESRGYAPYIKSMGETTKLLTAAGLDWEFWDLSGDAYVDRAKNTILAKFLEDPNNSDILMIDSDMSWDTIALLKMLSFPEEIVVGSYPMKNAWARWTSTPKVKQLEGGKIETYGRQLPDGGTILEGGELAGGFMLMKRGALEKFKEHYKDKIYKDVGADPGVPDRVYTEFFCCERWNPNPDEIPLRWGEDRVFSRRLAAMDLKWWIYTDINFGHFGVTGYHGNFHDYLSGNKGQKISGQQPVQAP